MRSRPSLAALLLALAMAALPSRAEEASAPVLSLHDLIVNAVNANLELSARRLEPVIQTNRLDAAKGAFEPSWIAAYTHSDSERPQNYLPTAGLAIGRYDPIYEERVHRVQTGLAGKLTTGLQYELITGIDRTDSTTTRNTTPSLASPGSRYAHEYVSSTTLSLTQPLLRDFGASANLAEVRLQRSAIKSARHELVATAQRILRDVAAAYYEMAFAQENVRVKQEAVAVAEALVRDNQRRVDEGRMAPIDVTQARARLSEANEELVVAENFLAQRRNGLRELTRDEFDFADAPFTVDPSRVLREAPALDRDAAIKTLFEVNPTYLAALEIARSEDVRIAYAKNQRWPRVDLKASIGYIGLSDNQWTAYEDYKERDQPTWSAGVVVNVPIGNRTGRARVTEAYNRKRQALLNVKRTEVALLAAFDNARRDIDSAVERTRLVQDTVKMAAAALDAQQRILGSGKTTSFEVAQAQRDLSQARSRELATLVDLNKAVSQLQFIVGTLPNELQVDLKVE